MMNHEAPVVNKNDAITKAQKTTCQYWSPSTCSCLLVSDGFLIPLPEYVALYCHTMNFTKCEHYQRVLNTSPLPENEQGEIINRRRANRIFWYLDFQFSKIMNDDFLHRFYTEPAWTIDISGYGIGFVSEQYISRETYIRFLIEKNFVIPESDGIGKVVWCKSLSKTTYFQVGMEFSMLCA